MILPPVAADSLRFVFINATISKSGPSTSSVTEQRFLAELVRMVPQPNDQILSAFTVRLGSDNDQSPWWIPGEEKAAEKDFNVYPLVIYQYVPHKAVAEVSKIGIL